MTADKKFDLVIFDLDGTLIDNRVAIRENFNHALKIRGYSEVESAKIDATIGLPLEEGFMRVAEGISLEEAKELAKEYRLRYRTTSHHGVALLEGIPEILVNLRTARVKTAIATTKANDELVPLLTKIGILEYFDFTLGRTEGLKMKPNPDMLNYIMEQLGVKPDRTVMIGDTYMDILAGKNARTYTIGVLTGVSLGIASRQLLEESKPDVMIDSLKKFEWASRKKAVL